MDLHTRSATESTPAASGSIPLQASLWRGETPRYAFSGHQTFPFRYAWLPKGVGAVREDPEAFLQPDALVRLGVGKNMVASIRFWCEALGLLDMRGRRGVLTPLGEFLFGTASPAASGRTSRRVREGADPYLEDPGTLWLLHWQLASRPYPASTWHLAFTRWGESVFTHAVPDGVHRTGDLDRTRDRGPGITRLLHKSKDSLSPRSDQERAPRKSVIPAKAGIQRLA